MSSTINPKSIYYNNSLLYLSVIENNFPLVEALLKKGYPKNVSDLPKKIRKDLSLEEYNKIYLAYQNVVTTLTKELIQDVSKVDLLKFFLNNIKSRNSNDFIFRSFRHYVSSCFVNNNIEAFKVFSEILGENTITDNASLQLYEFQVVKSKLPKKIKKELCNFIESYNIDWGNCPYFFERCSHLNNKEEFEFFYKKFKEANKNNISIKDIRRGFFKVIHNLLIQNIDINKNFENPILHHIINKKEFTSKNPYDGHYSLLKIAYRLAEKTDQDTSVIDNYFLSLIKTHPESIKHLNKYKSGIPQMRSLADKVLLAHQLRKELTNNPSRKTTLNTNKI